MGWAAARREAYTFCNFLTQQCDLAARAMRFVCLLEKFSLMSETS